MTYLLLAVIGVLVTAAAAPALATERVEWKGDPILIRLSPGFERRVIVQSATGISIGIPETATPHLHAQSIGDSFWLTASAPIDSPARIILKIHPDGTTVVAEVRTIPDIPPPENLFIALAADQPAAESPVEKRPGFASLTRWAIQQMYSPERLKQALPGVTRHSVNPDPVNLFRCGPNPPTSCGGAVEATPLAGWRTPTHYVTAIRLKNTIEKPVVLDPRELRGRWRTATFVHSRLRAAGQQGSSTILVTISDRPAQEALDQ